MTQPLTAQFKNYLAGKAKPKLSASTLKNYVSDVDQFLDWLAGQLQEETIEPLQLTATVFQNYCRYLNDPANRIHPATAERYLSSLKRFGEWLDAAKLTDSNPAAGLKPLNIDPTLDKVLADFKIGLAKQNLAPSTVKNYLSDVSHYLLWVDKNVKITERNIL